jgi:monoamine oxidase
MTHCETIRGESVCVDLGAMRIPTAHKRTYNLVKKFGLKTVPFIFESNRTKIRYGEQSMSFESYQKHPVILAALFNVEPAYQNQTAADIYDEAVAPVIKAINDPTQGWPWVKKHYVSGHGTVTDPILYSF